MVEYTLVSILVVMLVLGLLQLALALHVRNTMISCAAEGARLAAPEDRTLADGERRAEALLASSLGSYPLSAEASEGTLGGATVITVRVTAPVPLVGLWGFGTMTVEARALAESSDG